MTKHLLALALASLAGVGIGLAHGRHEPDHGHQHAPGCGHGVPIAEAAWAEYAALQQADQAKADKPVDPIEEFLAEIEDPKHRRDLQRDIELGRKYSAQADKEYPPSEDQAAIERVNRIGNEFAAIANVTPVNVTWGDKRLNRFPYVFKVVKSDDVNAFSIPGGYIYVFEGLLKYVESDHELAGVLAHEVAHASLRHVATLEAEANKMGVWQIPLILAGLLTGTSEVAMAGILTGQAQQSGWSVRAEQAADYAGFQYMQRSEYNPVGLLTFMERLAKDERMGPNFDPGIYRTHPPSQARARSLIAFMRSAGVPILRSQVTTSFRTTVKPGDKGTVDLFFGRRKLVTLTGQDALTRADEAADNLNAFFDAEPAPFEVLSTADGTVVGGRRPLFRLTAADASAAQVPLDELRKTTLNNIRQAIFNLSYRIWDRT